jgi:hypothetical protein
MKKLMLLLVTAFIVAGTQAQTKEEIEKRKAAKEEQAKLTSDQAAIDKEQAVLAEQARQEKIKMFKDSVIAETRAQWVKDSLRSIQDSSNKVQTENDRLSTEKYLAVDKSRNDVYTAAGLSDYEMQKVKVINSQYYARAKAINADESIAGDIKSKRLAALNKERLKKIKATLGGKKASALEKARKTTAQNAEDSDSQWLYEIDSTKGKKKS